MAKRKKWHQTKVAENRYLIWTLSIALIVCIALTSYASLTAYDIQRTYASEIFPLNHTTTPSTHRK